ncbi:hypothetical protein AT251_21405 [Enterovibrio nigricans]|nr:hypothetical protein AT251_21405 [Enterovibrio nigricans]
MFNSAIGEIALNQHAVSPLSCDFPMFFDGFKVTCQHMLSAKPMSFGLTAYCSHENQNVEHITTGRAVFETLKHGVLFVRY